MLKIFSALLWFGGRVCRGQTRTRRYRKEREGQRVLDEGFGI
jgi:hypothetical protein